MNGRRPGPFLGGPASYVIVSGHSMEPTLYTGDLVVVHQRDEYSVGDMVAFEIEGGSQVIHRIVGGSAAEYCDPTDEGSIAVTIERLLRDPSRLAELRAAGPEHAKGFSWDRTAQIVLETLDRIAHDRAVPRSSSRPGPPTPGG